MLTLGVSAIIPILFCAFNKIFRRLYLTFVYQQRESQTLNSLPKSFQTYEITEAIPVLKSSMSLIIPLIASSFDIAHLRGIIINIINKISPVKLKNSKYIKYYH